MPTTSSTARKAVVVGAGPVGCLAAVALAKMGWNVAVYEGRPDLRLPSSKSSTQQRSINIAISSRGIAALQAIDSAAAERFLQTVIPMRGRMIHDLKGNLDSQLYDRDGQCINSIDRTLLNEGLLEEASNTLNVQLSFNHKVQSIDFTNKSITLRDLNADKDISIDFDFCIGADGSYSVVRRQMMRVVRMDYLQEYIPHEYIELKMPAGTDAAGGSFFLLDPNHLHIWPRHSFMLIALPNKDKTFTCTLFAPNEEFDRLITPEIILPWFRSQFPDALSLIGEEALVRDFTLNPRSPLICTKSKPYHYQDCALLLGDAAHSMVPFYGQGLNCGLEDVRVLNTLLRQEAVDPATSPGSSGSKHGIDLRLARALARYSATRHEDLVAIGELAMGNYEEMRHSVTTPAYIFKKSLDNILYSLSSASSVSLASLGPTLSRMPFPPQEPSGWLPLYTMVTFRPDISYATARKKATRQSRILAGAGYITTAVLGVAGFWVTWITWLRRTQAYK